MIWKHRPIGRQIFQVWLMLLISINALEPKWIDRHIMQYFKNILLKKILAVQLTMAFHIVVAKMLAEWR